MLDPWIIEEIRRREEAERKEQRPTLDIRIEMPTEPDRNTNYGGDVGKTDRGVAIIDFST